MVNLPAPFPTNDEPADGPTGHLVLAHAGQALDHVIVQDVTGKTIANRPLPFGAVLPTAADDALHALGFRRVGNWTHVRRGEWLRCNVVRLA